MHKTTYFEQKSFKNIRDPIEDRRHPTDNILSSRKRIKIPFTEASKTWGWKTENSLGGGKSRALTCLMYGRILLFFLAFSASSFKGLDLQLIALEYYSMGFPFRVWLAGFNERGGKNVYNAIFRLLLLWVLRNIFHWLVKKSM